MRLLRNVLHKRRLALAPLDDGMRAELESFVDTVEAHAVALKQYAGEGVPRLKLPLPQRYLAECGTSDDARWCIEHLRAIEAVDDLPAMIDILTKLLQRADRASAAQTQDGGKDFL